MVLNSEYQLAMKKLDEVVEKEISIGRCMYHIAMKTGDKNALLSFLNDINKRYDVIEYEMIRNGLINWIESQS